MKNRKLYIFHLLILCFTFNSCVEIFDFKTINFEDALVVEATITDEFKHQEINLTRTFQFEEEGPIVESEASITIIDSSQKKYNFQEASLGKYISINKFKAEPNITYQLSIVTKDGGNYTSIPSQLPQSSQFEDISAIKETAPNGEKGITIYANSFDPTGNARYYRYEYEETYKIRAILWSPLDAIIVSEVPPSVTTTPRTQEERICFNTFRSIEIVQTQTTDLQEDRVSQFPIRFIASTNPILKERYSILIRQYVQSLEAFNYYKVQSELSGNESLLSQNQPGFVSSNISSVNNRDEKVLGFFEITSVSSKRVFFNFRDNFTEENSPFYFVDCEFVAPLLVAPDNPNVSPLINLIKLNTHKFYDFNLPREGLPGPYLMIEKGCSDCTEFGTNVRPNFWVD